MSRFEKNGGRLVYRFDGEQVWIEPWGTDALRVRAARGPQMPDYDWALLEPGEQMGKISLEEDEAQIENGKIRAKITKRGKLTFFNRRGSVLLEEYVRTKDDLTEENCSSMGIYAREYRGIPGGDYEIFVRFESEQKEKIFGMGQYQQACFDLKGCDLELAQRNSQVSVPFYISSLGYGFLWNNPAIGNVAFGKNRTTWYMHSARYVDYWITAGDTPMQIEEAYAKAVGTVPMMPDYGMGFWQCKLRYQTKEELLEVAREYKRRGLPISVIVADYFHWPRQGDWRFDPDFWPEPEKMADELRQMGIELMVSVWPTVDAKSENYEEMLEKGYLVWADRGLRMSMSFHGNVMNYDATNPEARAYLWDKIKNNYYDKGIKLFWLDETEPEYSTHDFDLYRYSLGTNLQVGNYYPLLHAKGFYDGLSKEGEKNILSLVRCAWAGAQRYGACVWSGDIYSSFHSLYIQIIAGLHMGIAGIPWWTTDIGGFHGGDPASGEFRELLIRWFEYGTFCPIMRLHGDRIPKQPRVGHTGGSACLSGAPNEVWSFGEEVYEICKKYLNIRERLRPYIKGLMREAHERGTPVMKPLFYDYPEDERAWEIEDEYLFGSAVLVAPVYQKGVRSRKVYLPSGTRWVNAWNHETLDGGREIRVPCPLDQIPLFYKEGFCKFNTPLPAAGCLIDLQG